MAVEIKIPDLGENISGGRVVSILAAAGTAMEAEQPLLEIETDKAVIEMPCPVSGTILKLMINEGEDVVIGQVICLLEEVKEGKPDTGETAVKNRDASIETRPEQPAPIEEAKTESGRSTASAAPETQPVSTKTDAFIPAERTDTQMVPAAPSVRRFAREIGINIQTVPGSGPGGRISKEDVKQWSKQLNSRREQGASALNGGYSEVLPDFGKWGETDRQPLSRLREASAKHLSYAWAVIPHVTQFDKADITELEKLRKKYAPQTAAAGGKLTVTVILLKIIQQALKRFPEFNASIDMERNEIIYKKYFNVGVAVDTEYGLLVPVIKNADQKNIIELAAELASLSQKAKDRKLSLDEMQGGNFTISNLGGIGGTGFTPVVNSPEAAILGVSRAEMQPVYQDGAFVPRRIMPLSLSYDHRIIDGAAAARFLRWVCRALEEPFLLALEG